MSGRHLGLHGPGVQGKGNGWHIDDKSGAQRRRKGHSGGGGGVERDEGLGQSFMEFCCVTKFQERESGQ